MRNRVNETIQRIKRDFWEKFSADMEYDLYGAQKRVWNMLKNRKKHVNEFVQTIKITSEEWEKHFADLYRNEDGNEKTDNICAEEPGHTPGLHYYHRGNTKNNQKAKKS